MSTDVTRPGIAIDPEFVQRAAAALAQVPALAPPDKDGERLLEAIGKAVGTASDIAKKNKLSADMKKAAEADKPKAPPKVELPNATFAGDVADQKKKGKDSSLALGA
jgi:hypothetical protein